ncbi:hypothetical protein L3Q82_020105 [Scortum barcoo]|uniref:Uncharacterized protein n=1 Tax=Scortum barcoo TaxID=214431 RepID=A0ACB8VDM1_9TELE|nr:hypothetical protein L3Q82_020105 [Scortum barcoo]
MPSPDPQSTCGLVGQTPINPQAPCGEYGAGPVFHDRDENRIVPPESEGSTIRPNSPLQYPGIDLPGEVEKCVGSAMNQCEETEEGVPPSKTTLCGEHDGQTKAQSPEQQRPDSPEPEPSCVSIKSHRSMSQPLVFKEQLPSETHVHQQRPDSPVPSCVSMKSDKSMFEPFNFSDRHHFVQKKVQKVPGGRSVQQHPSELDSVFRHLEENIFTFVKNELKKFQKVLSPDYPERLSEDEMVDGEEEEQRKSSREAFLKITLHFLRRMNQEELADCLQSRTVAPICRHQLKSNLKKKFQCVFEGIAKAGNRTLLNQIYTELYITERRDCRGQ